MKFLLDESADYPLRAFLERLGHDVTAIAHDYPHAIKDREVLAIAYSEQRILITNDRDFGELIFRQRLPHAGVILIRLENENLAIKSEWLSRILTEYRSELQYFLVITERGVRIRKY